MIDQRESGHSIFIRRVPRRRARPDRLRGPDSEQRIDSGRGAKAHSAQQEPAERLVGAALALPERLPPATPRMPLLLTKTWANPRGSGGYAGCKSIYLC